MCRQWLYNPLIGPLPAHRLLRPCREVCPQALAVLAHGVIDVLRLAGQGVRIQIQTAEEVQDAISGMYAILQLHGSYLTTQCAATGPAAVVDAAEAMMLLLQVCNCKGGMCGALHASLILQSASTVWQKAMSGCMQEVAIDHRILAGQTLKTVARIKYEMEIDHQRKKV